MEILGPDPGRWRKLLRFAHNMCAAPFGQRKKARVTQAAKPRNARLQFVAHAAQWQRRMKEFQDVLGKRALVARAVANLLPEDHRVAQLVQGHQPQPAVMFRQNEWSAAFRQRVSVTLLDCAAGLLSGDGEVLFFYRQIATGNQAN